MQIMNMNSDDNTLQAQTVSDEPEDVVPFAWRHPLIMPGRKKVSKVLRAITDAESERAALVPTGNPDE